MKRYLLFAGYTYYPCGGWRDFVESFDTLEELIRAVCTPLEQADNSPKYDWQHAVDTQTGVVVWHNDKSTI